MNRRKELLFEKSYEKYARLLLKIIYSYIQNYDDCQDILQEVFYRLLYKAPRFKSEEHQKRWLIKIAINLSKDYLKSFWQRHYICGYHVAEIGRLLDIGESAVKMRLSRARQMLRLEMEES